jgi:diphosphomevalonate decarboxylase
MGKRAGGNIASNSSLSWTLDHLRSFVQLEEAAEDSWQPHPAWPQIEMSNLGREKYLAHLSLLKKYYSAENYFFKIRSGNNFPSDCGIASSASSFAALTLVAAQALSSLTKKAMPTKETLADWSRQGSGSSCRSFFPGFVSWTERGVEPVESVLKNIYHQTVIVSGAKKQVSSSQAHQRVQSSLLMDGREDRAQKRFDLLKTELQKSAPDWKILFEITWADFWDMHALFETSVPSFGYMQSESLVVLQKARELWQEKNDGPLITMDAGPNVHLLWRSEQREMAQAFSKKYSQWQWIESSND